MRKAESLQSRLFQASTMIPNLAVGHREYISNSRGRQVSRVRSFGRSPFHRRSLSRAQRRRRLTTLIRYLNGPFQPRLQFRRLREQLFTRANQSRKPAVEPPGGLVADQQDGPVNDDEGADVMAGVAEVDERGLDYCWPAFDRSVMSTGHGNE